MLFGVIQILSREMGKKEVVEVTRYEYGYGEAPVDIRDLLHPPMTLAQGAAIMNEYRKLVGDEEGGEDLSSPPTP